VSIVNRQGAPPGAPALVGDGTAQPDRQVAVRLSGVSKRYGSGPRSVLALDQVSLEVAVGEFV